jgi:hypothetical protein
MNFDDPWKKACNEKWEMQKQKEHNENDIEGNSQNGITRLFWRQGLCAIPTAVWNVNFDHLYSLTTGV